MAEHGCLLQSKQLGYMLIAVLLLGFVPQGLAGSGLMQVPQYLNRSMPANLFLSINLAESDGLVLAQRLLEYTEAYHDSDRPWLQNANFNSLYYDPLRDYQAPYDVEGSPRPNAEFTAASLDVFAGKDSAVDLSRDFIPRWSIERVPRRLAEPAYYYRFEPSKSPCKQFWQALVSGDSSVVPDTAIDYATLCFSKVAVTETSGELRYRPILGHDSRDERANFANWYQYYSTELLRIQSELSLQLNTARLGSFPLRTVFRAPRDIASLTGEQLQQPGFLPDALLEDLFNHALAPPERAAEMPSSVQLHRSLEGRLALRASQSFFRTSDPIPVAKDHACRHNLALITSAGSSSEQSSSTDLRADLDNVLIPDPAWQRLRTATIGLADNPGRDFSAKLSREISAALTLSLQLPEKFLLTGRAFSPLDDEQYLTGIDAKTSTGFLVAVNGSDSANNCLRDDAQILCDGVWNVINRNGDTATEQRRIFSYNPSRALGERGTLFKWHDDLSPRQRQVLRSNADIDVAKQRLDYLRGSAALEQRNGGLLRDRVQTSLAAVNKGELLVVGNGLEPASQADSWQRQVFYPDDLEGPHAQSHREFVCDDAQLNEWGEILRCGHGSALRQPVVYVGAADGMLHAYGAGDADSGKELFAYIPEALAPRLESLMHPQFALQSVVDGPLTHADVYYQSRWHSLLLGALGAGGQAYYALDITSPSAFSPAHVKEIVRWEFSDRDDPDLGFTVGKAIIVKSNYRGRDGSGRWVAVFGNGVNSTYADGAVGSGAAVLFVVDIETGALIRKLSTAVGDRAHPNGLFTPALVFNDDDYRADFAYAGDALGNLWKFDISASDPDLWHVAFANKPFFKVKDSTGLAQIVSTQPLVVPHPQGLGGRLVLAGTGRYLYPQDHGEFKANQSFYALWDHDETPIAARSDLLRQQLRASASSRRLSDTAIDWGRHRGWLIDFADKRERIISPALATAGSVYFSTLVTSSSACDSAAHSWLMTADSNNGGTPAAPSLDINNDGNIDSLDLQDGNIVSGIALSAPVSILSLRPCDSETCIVTDAVTVPPLRIEPVVSNGRRRWRRLH